MVGLRRCYRQRLETSPTATANLVLGFKVDDTGATTVTSVRGVDSTLGACVRKAASSWRFTPPKDAYAKSTSATFELPLTITSAGS